MFNKILFVFIFFSAFISYAQTDKVAEIERLKDEIQQATYYDSSTVFKLGKTCIELANKLNKPAEIGYIYQYYGSFYYFSNNEVKAKEFYQKSIQIAEENKDEELLLSTKIRLNFMLIETDLNAAEKEFLSLLKQAQQKKFVKNEIYIHNGLGIVYETMSMDDKATKSYINGLILAEKHNYKTEISILLNNIGLLKIYHKKYKSAKIDLEQALAIAKEKKQLRLQLNILNNLGLLSKKTKDIKGSISHYKQTVYEAKKIGFPVGIIVAYINLSSSYLENNQTLFAQKYADSASILAYRYKDITQIKNTLIIKGLIYLTTHKLDKGKSCIDSITLLQKTNYSDEHQSRLYDLLTTYYEQVKDYKQAYLYAVRRSEFNDSIVTIGNERELNRLQEIFEKDRMQSELTTLNQQNKILQTNAQLKQVNLRFYLLIAGSFFVGVLLVFYIFHIRKSRRLKSQFSQDLIEQIDQERSRISNDLHDDIGQSLAIVKSKLNLFQTKKINTIDHLDVEIGEILEKTRTLSHQLHPSALEKIGLEKALSYLLNKTQQATDLVCSMDYHSPTMQLTPFQNAQIYRVIQECIQNTVKHAHATALKVRIEQSGNHLIIEYRDNGIGIKQQDIQKGIGFLTIRERCEIINAKFELKTGKNKGIILKLTL